MALPSELARTQIYLTAQQQQQLSLLARQQGCSSSALIRTAIDDFLQIHHPQERLAKRLRSAGTWDAKAARPSLDELRSEARSF
ncbi:MAG: hypothetical protein RLZZ470_57 [Pseudomonadota bacterium]|jgi:hypothetical protein